ncbi:MAG TPA: LpxL/LpxP family Kdo(2)-lipid IV(A) lauroyl/palmitoleoyl acyltransferase [Xanthomonadales bacterium]|nr:LpxL/LpxP family Kdo(2)-lipid IV(A) lauroyl/palmitoleoyl acyltransferase [Xanthomonadales bacterium]
MRKKFPKRPSLAPRNWPGWAAVALLWVLGWLPHRLGLALVWPIGPLAYRFAGRRRSVAERNLQSCFPEWSEAQRDVVVRACFGSVARMVAEMAWCWSGPARHIDRLGRIHGLENLAEAEERGNGVLLVTHHTTCLDIGSRILLGRARFGGVYRPLNNPVMEWYQTRGRLRYAEFMISKRNALQAVKVLKRGGVVWYAPDQDFGPEQSVFAPFFNIRAATLLATHRLPAITGCAVVPMFPVYHRADERYDVHVLPALEDYPSNDPVADLTRINALIEEWVRKAPEQYWWIHRRFKTRPKGEPPFYD